VENAIALLAFGCVFLLVMGLNMVLRTRPAGRRLAHLSSGFAAPAEERPSLVRQCGGGVIGVFHRIGEQRREGSDIGRLRARLVRAGYQNPAAPAIYYGVRLSLALALPVLALPLPVLWGLPFLYQIALLCGLAGVGYIAPSLLVDRRASVRMRAIERTLPDALDLMVVCVEAGFGINQSLARVAEEFATKSPILAKEFGLVVHETRAGKSTHEALRGLSDRTGVSDISSLVALLVQTERFGTSVANTLRVHAEAMRVRRMQRAEERAQKATLKLILPSTMIFGALLMIFLLPGIYRFFGAFPSE
jgi:tight adherence protein C